MVLSDAYHLTYQYDFHLSFNLSIVTTFGDLVNDRKTCPFIKHLARRVRTVILLDN